MHSGISAAFLKSLLTSGSVYGTLWMIRRRLTLRTENPFLKQKGNEMHMVIERSRIIYHPMRIPQADILIHTLPYPVKRIRFGA